MKHELFISYSDADYDKVKLIIEELKSHTTFKPLIIANNRQAGKLLADKVKNGINRAHIIIPILTENSIKEQWLNQEIGYATAMNKKIMPIIQRDLIDNLKGFIHKQIDLPYKYSKGTNVGKLMWRLSEQKKENSDFIKCFKILIKDIEKNLDNIIKQENKLKTKSAPRSA